MQAVGFRRDTNPSRLENVFGVVVVGDRATGAVAIPDAVRRVSYDEIDALAGELI